MKIAITASNFASQDPTLLELTKKYADEVVLNLYRRMPTKEELLHGHVKVITQFVIPAPAFAGAGSSGDPILLMYYWFPGPKGSLQDLHGDDLDSHFRGNDDKLT